MILLFYLNFILLFL